MISSGISLWIGWHALLGASAGITAHYTMMAFIFAILPSSGNGPPILLSFLLSHPDTMLLILMPLTLVVAAQSIRRHAGTPKMYLAFSAGTAATCFVTISLWPFYALIIELTYAKRSCLEQF